MPETIEQRIATALGIGFHVRPAYSTDGPPCDLEVRWRDPYFQDTEWTGSITICMENRRWCGGLSWHGWGSSVSRDFFGLDGQRKYKGRKWPEELALDVRTGIARMLVDSPSARDAGKVPTWAWEAAGDDWLKTEGLTKPRG